MSSPEQESPDEGVAIDDREAELEALADLLARHLRSVQLMRLDAGIDAIEVSAVAEILAEMEQLAVALRHHVERPRSSSDSDEALAEGARTALPEAHDAPCPVKRAIPRPLPAGWFSASGAGWPPPIAADAPRLNSARDT